MLKEKRKKKSDKDMANIYVTMSPQAKTGKKFKYESDKYLQKGL